MPVEYDVDHERRRVTARIRGHIEFDELTGYQREVWAREDVRGYDELVDLTEFAGISGADDITRAAKVLAGLSSSMDSPEPSKLAVVAPDDMAFGLNRMYEAYRERAEGSTRIVSVFRQFDDAWAWLDERD